MSKFSTVMFLIFLCYSLSAKLSKKKYGEGRGENCGLFHPCANGLECKDAICVVKGEKTHKKTYAPMGDYCDDIIHKCANFYICERNRCVLQITDLGNYLAKKEAEEKAEEEEKPEQPKDEAEPEAQN